MTEFFAALVPPTITRQQHKITVRDGKPRYYDPPELKAARMKLAAYLAQYAPTEPYTGGVRLVVKWCFPVKRGHRDGEYRTTKPDVTNLQKMLEDVMTDLGFWIDDSLIACSIVEKFWAYRPGIYIKIMPLEELT